MTKQITVRLPDDIVDFIDRTVEEGGVASRAAVVSKALERERRRERAAHDARILAEAPSDDDLHAVSQYAATLPIELA
ncbi:ribbon-helix-helix domain-containing protein [Arthrobacter sp. H14]|uniref:ribbon-helix-helix domain-containing protein n=1 Tax=Arthrobacter sp. H14 TaxID=1312959 RepID=UPI00047C08BC|nr:ribbon-helix-helix domain-containing protein [Arthrobacter sp. H14]